MPRARVLLATSIAVVLVASLAACAPDDRESLFEPTPTATSDAPEPTPTVAPSFDPALSAVENQPYFDTVMRALIHEDQTPGGKKVVNALVAAGFDKRAIEVTFDKTAVDLVADSLQFSVQINGGCIVGQYGNVKYLSVIAPVLGSGKCFVGKTRPIDW